MAAAQLEDRGARLGQRQRERADRALVAGAEAGPVGCRDDLLDPGLRGGDRAGPLFVGAAQQVAPVVDPEPARYIELDESESSVSGRG